MMNRYTRQVQAGMRLVLARYRPPKGTKIKRGVLGKNAPQRWYQVCAVGDTVDGRTVSTAFLKHYVADFYSRPEPGPVYLGHCDVDLPPGVEEPPARAWVLALSLTADGELWALYEMTAGLTKAIAAGGYRYNSINGAMVLDDSGAVVGAEFHSIAVTNSPAVPGLVPMAASRQRKGVRLMSIHDILKEAIKELPDDATPEALMAYVQGKMAVESAIEGGDAPADAPADEPMAEEAPPEAPIAAEVEPAEAAAPVELMPEEGAPSAGAEAALTMVAEAMGTDLASVVAAIQERPDAVAQALAGTPESGSPGQDEAQMAAELSAARSKDQAAVLKRTTLALAKAKMELVDARITLAAERGHILDTEAATLRKFADTSPDVVLSRLVEAEGSPAVPTGAPVVVAPPVRGPKEAPKSEIVARYHAALSHIKDPAERERTAREKAEAHAERVSQINTRGRRRRPAVTTD